MCSLCMKFYVVIPAFRESYGTVLSCGAVYITVLFSLFKFVWKKICSGISFNMKPPLQYFYMIIPFSSVLHHETYWEF